jgi:hypothetical protein
MRQLTTCVGTCGTAPELQTAPPTSPGGDDEYNSLYDNLCEPAACPARATT